MIGWKITGNFVSQWYHVKWWREFCAETLKKKWKKKMASRKILRHFVLAKFFMFLLLISNYTAFLVPFEINLHFWVFQKAEIALAQGARAILSFWGTRKCKLIPNWTQNRTITYTYYCKKQIDVSFHASDLVSRPTRLSPRGSTATLTMLWRNDE